MQITTIMIPQLLLPVTVLFLGTVAAVGSPSSSSINTSATIPHLQFTKASYNASIAENSQAKTWVTPENERMGIQLPDINSSWDIKYRIVAGDKDKFFKAEERIVGDFCFLMLRTRTGNNDVLNRERKDRYVLEIHATAVKHESKYASSQQRSPFKLELNTNVIVTILDTNDLNPLFDPTEYSVTVSEDTALHKSIARVSAEDADLGRNGEIYYSFVERTEYLAIHPMSGVVTLTKPLRYTDRAIHELTVVAQDRGSSYKQGAGRPSTAKLTVRVKQVNLHSPEIYVHALPDVVEHSNADIYAIVRVVDKDTGIHGQIKSLEIVGGDPDGHFRIRKHPGTPDNEYNIEIVSLLDREVAPQGYNLTLLAIDNGEPPRQSYKSVPVHLSDLNDNAPVFDREIYEVDVPETAPINTPVICLKVTDADQGKNAQVFLEIVGGNENGEFHINAETGMLYTSVPLDAETKAFYTLTVSAIDQGNAGTRKQSSAKVKVNVVDTNDNDPIFEQSEDTVWIDENEPGGTSVTKVTARDRDSGENAYISYSIANLNKVPFEIDHFSGIVKTTMVLDYESMRREYILRVRASDWGMPYRRQTEMQLKIRVRDVNDNRPQFEKINCSGHVPRYLKIGSEIITLSAIDFDAGNIISYRLVSGNEDNCFSLDSTTGVLTVNCDLGDVKVAERELNVTATDGTHFADVSRVIMYLVNAKPTRLLNQETGYFECSDTGVARRLTEVLASAERNNVPGRNGILEEFAMMPSRYGENVHTPELYEFPNQLSVNESVPLGTTLIRIKARDRDLGYNGKLIFGISSGDSDSVFRLDPETGDLVVIGYLDRERTDSYLLNVSVYDLGKPQKSSSKFFSIVVLDVNDNSPKFEKSVASFRVTENARNGTIIFTANATDIDLGSNAQVVYSLVTDTKDFSIDPVSGILSVSSALDRERQSIYELRIRALDCNGKGTPDRPPLISSALVRVTIDDVNDNAPQFALPNMTTVKIREDVPVGTVVAVLTATDPDLGRGGQIVYSIVGDLSDKIFRVDRTTGTIRTAERLDFEQRQVHTVVVRAADQGTPELSTDTTLLVEVVDVNENIHAPHFDDFVILATVRENRPPGTHVTTVRATDEDLPTTDDGRLSYSIRGGDGIGLFNIDNQGIIRTAAVLDLESKRHYWLTVYAQDHGVVPLHARLEVYVSVANENDNAPLTLLPVYYPHVPENSPDGTLVVQLHAEDHDLDPRQRLTYRITAGNPESFFAIETDTGLIKTTSRKLDRENQPEHILEVTVSDNGTPPLASTTRVLVTVDDTNDHDPEFEQSESTFYKVTIPASAPVDGPLFQNLTSLPSSDVDGEVAGIDSFFENATWESYDPAEITGEPIFRVLGFDRDIGANGELSYSIKSGRGMGKFRIHNRTGVVYAQRTFQPDQEYDLRVRAQDGGEPPRAHTTRVAITVAAVPSSSPNPPQVKAPPQPLAVTESDHAGFLVHLVQATDPDGDMLWYNIVGGDDYNEFFIGSDKGNILLAKQLDWETRNKYNLNVSVTDGVHTVYSKVVVNVIDINDHRPRFTERVYTVDISENVEPGTKILQLQATDADEDKKVFYSLHAARSTASLAIFRVDSMTGAIYLNEKLDRETIEEHVLTVMVKDQGTPSQRNYARVLVTVHDHNDHAPEFTSQLVEGKVYETSPVGARVVQVFAIDRDRGENARITYTITAGNVGNVFYINPTLGTIHVARELDLSAMAEYTLIVKATDNGAPALSSTIPVHVMVTMADNAPPRFIKKELAAEIFENQPVGSYVKHIEVRATSSLLFDLIGGNDDDMFMINPSTGVITTKRALDYELRKFYNLTIEATNMAAAKARCQVIVHVLDCNDNPPRFVQAVYSGSVAESAPIGALVLNNTSAPLVIKAKDDDSELNALLDYEIVETLPRKYFHIDSSTGAIRTVMTLDHETIPKFDFYVKVSDLGKPRLSSEMSARVQILVTDVNDCPPKFTQSVYNATVLLPTYQDVTVIHLNATDPDSGEGDTALRYDIIDGNTGNIFALDSQFGILTVAEPLHVKSFHRLHVRVSDGKYSSVALVNIRVEKSEHSGLTFQKPVYFGNILENSTKEMNVAVVNVLGTALNEHIVFSILNPTDMFTIGPTSGAIKTTGKRFDRELKDNYELIVEARSSEGIEDHPRVAHVIVNVTILDINDNCPMFVNLPYYAVVSVDAQKGDSITKVHAVDMDKGENGEVRYELNKGNGEMFKISRKTGEVTLKQNLEGHNREYELRIGAYDGGIPACSKEVPLHVKVIDRSMPIFDKQFYTDSVAEDIQLHSPLTVSIQAESPLGRKLIYSIVRGNEFEEFALDFNTAPDSNNGPCVISVVDELDYESKKQYELTIRATDSVSGVFAEVLVSILVTDVNDSPPEFASDSYNISISEAAPFGTSVLKVHAHDNDTGVNQVIRYSLSKDSGNSSQYFHVDPEDGSIYLKQSLDHELSPYHHLAIVATDSGVRSLNTTAHIWVTVLDMNDNPPKFEQTSYSCALSQNAKRGQFVTVVTASDPDEVDQERLLYTIVGGNEQQTYSIDPTSGIITLINMQNFAERPITILNISVTDGVYTSFTRVKIELLPANRHNPTFSKHQIEVKVTENAPPGSTVTKVRAQDLDLGIYADIVYSIPSDRLSEFFDIDRLSGEIVTRRKLDRETRKLYEIPIMATDGGGRSGFLNVRVRVGDENDNAPRFLIREYKATISSNLTTNSVFIKVRAVDDDEDLNAEIEYSLYETQTSGVQELFGINSQTGGIYLLKSAVPWENQVFQFFVRAQDRGSPKSLHADVPMDVFIMGPHDQAPMFERKDDKFFTSENSSPGTIITKLKLVTNSSVRFRLVSGNEPNLFAVDSSGQLTVASPLDRETHDSHLVAVLAETDSSPPLTALAEFLLSVLDENDNQPQFESSPYVIQLAENVEEGTSILKVTAIDRDQGSNGEVRYALASDVGELANVFAVDAYTGWITTLVRLDRETQPEYDFQIVATDNGSPKHFARTKVRVRLLDYNDNPPIFSSKHYEAAVNEDALPGTVVVQLTTTDLDSPELLTPLVYHVTGGDTRSQFQIRGTGELYVAKALDRESIPRYDLAITATDGKFVAVTRVSIDILDANDNPPYCLKYRYREILSEGVHPGTFVLSVLAVDIDEEPNANLRYYLDGPGASSFTLDKAEGHLKTAKPLDREKQAKYQLTAHVQDRDKPAWKCSSQIEIVVSDLNDNAPQFSMDSYSATLSEDVEVGTLVTKIHATDDDIGINRKIKYSLIDSADNHFKIANDSGIITLAKPLDRETCAMYNLTVQAVDQGNPQLSRQGKLQVMVLDINDNPPEFASKYYFATVPEIDEPGTEIVRVLATSKDTGINAEVFYSIVGGNEHKKFSIDTKTGVITIAERLDYERGKDYYLTIQAMDRGVPPLSNHATVNISITDSNDNAPIFNQMVYSARIREDAQSGDRILQVVANDLDSDKNGEVEYSIEGGNRYGQFRIDSVSGYISVAGPLDRELVSSYVLEVVAKDQGLPQLSSQVLVNIEISDANDNPPLFSSNNYTAIIQEDKPLGSSVLSFIVTDADASSNGPPYTFDFRSGNEGSYFRLEQDGILRTAAKFNHKHRDRYTLHVRVFDNGTPPLFSDTWVYVKIIEESQYPPIITPLEISVNSYLDEYPGGIIGQVHASDQDPYDTLVFALVDSTTGSHLQNPATELFKLNRSNGILEALPRLDVGEYRINVTVSDGKYLSHAQVKINVDLVSDEMLAHSVIVRFRDVNPLTFILSHRKGFFRVVRNSLTSKSKDISILSVQTVDGSFLDVLLAVRKTTGGFYTREVLRKSLIQNLEEIDIATGLVVEEIIRDKCTLKHCSYGQCKERVKMDASKMTPISTDVTSFVSPRHSHDTHCICKEGYAGERCDKIVNECAREPCPVSKLCVPDSSSKGYSCQCPEGFGGNACEIDISKCHDKSCYIPRNPVSFMGKSYARYRIDKSLVKQTLEEQLILSLRLRTMQPTGNLMYAAGIVDYNILEIVNGVVQYRFELGSGEGLVRVSSIYVSDGQWHEVLLEREGNNARVTVDGKYLAHGSAPGVSDILNLQNEELYLGAEVRNHPSILGFDDVQRGFTGCLDDVRIARVSVPLHASGASRVARLERFANVEFSCEASIALASPTVCSSQPCLNGGTCREKGDAYECSCHNRYAGLRCELDTDPCGSQPCLHGARCSKSGPLGSEFECECPLGLSGRRCEYGHHCSPNPCRHGGACEEGDDGPICKCRGYSGELCTLDINECEASPCLNGATCKNEPGSYRCVCPPNVTGPLCAAPVYTAPITSSIHNFTLEEAAWIAGGVGIIIILVILFIFYRRYRVRRSRSGGDQIINETRKDIVLNSTRPHESEFKRGSKLSNLEVSQVPPQCPPRPLSYTPSSNTDSAPSYPHSAATVLNNLDTLRSYGSAGDELENIPPDYLRNLNRNPLPTATPALPDTHSHTHHTHSGEGAHKAWQEDLPAYSDHSKIKNDMKRSNPSEAPTKGLLGLLSRGGSRPSPGGSTIDDDPADYHWDCSDWVQRSQNPLPNITEVPGSEVPDSSSFHSNESNESNSQHGAALLPVVGPVDPIRDIETLDEDAESEYIGSTGVELDDDFTFPDAAAYLRHPNTYLPTFNLGGAGSETEPEIPATVKTTTVTTNPKNPLQRLRIGETTTDDDDDDDDDVEPYGFPSTRRRDLAERTSLLAPAGGTGSQSDISTHLCDIDDSELENESTASNASRKPLRWQGITQTSV